MQRAVSIVLVPALLVATGIAFLATEALKLERPPISRPHFGFSAPWAAVRFSPVGAAATAVAPVGFRLRRASRARVSVIDGGGRVVAVLANRRFPAGDVRLRWDGRTAAGLRVAPDGVYHLQVALPGRTVVMQANDVVVDTRPPQVALVVTPRRFSPDGDGRHDFAVARWTADEQLAGVRLEIRRGGRLLRTITTLRSRRAPTTITWDGRVRAGGPRAPAGAYTLRLHGTDQAGNAFAVARDVTLRYLALVPPPRALRAGRRGLVGIDADARSVRFTLARVVRPGVLRPVAAGRARPPALVLRLPAAAPGGVYRLAARFVHAAETVLAVRAAVPGRVALVLGPAPVALAPLRPWLGRLADAGARYDALTPADVASGLLPRYAVAVVPDPAALTARERLALDRFGGRDVRRLDGVAAAAR